MAGDRRRQRQQRVRHEPGGGSQTETNHTTHQRSNNQQQKKTGVAFAEEKEYEAVTIMESKNDKDSAPEKEGHRYKRRQVLSNWSRYEEVMDDDEIEEGEDYLLGEDFSQVVEMNEGRKGGFLHLKGEATWGESDAGLLDSHGLGSLKLADLVAAISTIPFQQQLNIPEGILDTELLKQFTLTAEANQENYKSNQQFASDDDVNKTFLETLKLSKDDQISLPANTVEANKTIDTTAFLESAFLPEDGDVDLEELINDSNQTLKQDMTSVNNNRNKVVISADLKEKSPSPAVISSNLKEKSPSPAVISSNLKEKSPSPAVISSNLKEKSPSPAVISSNIKEKSPSPMITPKGPIEIQRNIKGIQEQSDKPIDVPPLVKVSQSTAKPDQPTTNSSFNFGLPTAENQIQVPKLETNLPKGQRSKRGNRNKQNPNKTDESVDKTDPSTGKTEESVDKLDDDATLVDIDAPVVRTEQNVLVTSSSEKQDLEDWLDSVLDD